VEEKKRGELLTLRLTLKRRREEEETLNL